MRCSKSRHLSRWFMLTMAVLLWVVSLAAASTPIPENGLVDVMVVIDNSGSMRKNDPHFLTPKTVRTFLEQLPEGTRVGMVLFDERARLLQPLIELTDADAMKRLADNLEKIDYHGKFTDSAAGIERAAYELKTNGRSGARKSIVFLTDGIVDTGDRKKDAALTQWLKADLSADCRASQVRILGIAFTDNADFPLIQTLASRTEGAYFRATNPEDIAVVLDRIQALLSPSEPQIPAAAEEPSSAPQHTAAEPVSEPAANTVRAFDATRDTAPMPEMEAPRGLWKFYLPLILILFVLAGLVGLLVVKRLNLPSRAGGRGKAQAPIFGAMGPSLPEWELHELGAGNGVVRRFDKPRVTVGRDDKNDLMLPTPTVSNLHAIIDYREGAFFLEDQRSTNGTRLNDHQVRANNPVRLKSGDRIHFANLTFKFVRRDQIVSGDTVMLEITTLEAPEDLSSSEASIGSESEKNLQVCLERHLRLIRQLGEKYADFTKVYFPKEMCAAIAVRAHENMALSDDDHCQHCSPLINRNAFYVVCSLPVPAEDAVDWFGRHFGGFTRFIFKWIKSDGYDVTACDQFCVVCFGSAPQPWVSMTVVPTHDDADPVEIMSVNFLTDAEKSDLGLEFDAHGRVL